MPLNTEKLNGNGNSKGFTPQPSRSPQTPLEPKSRNVAPVDQQAVTRPAQTIASQTNANLQQLQAGRDQAKQATKQAIKQALCPTTFWEECLSEAIQEIGGGGESSPQVEDWGFGEFQITIEVPQLLSARERAIGQLPSSPA